MLVVVSARNAQGLKRCFRFGFERDIVEVSAIRPYLYKGKEAVFELTSSVRNGKIEVGTRSGISDGKRVTLLLTLNGFPIDDDSPILKKPSVF